MATGIDFMAIARGRQAALSDNYKDIRRIQEQEDDALKRESALAKHLQEQQGREAATYLSTVLPNLQRYADNGLNPVDALVNQMQAIQNDPAFQGMAPQVQQQIHQGLRQTAALQAEALAKAGNYGELQRLTSAFGQVNPVNPLGEAISTGDPMAIFNAVKARGAALELSPDGKSVVDASGRSMPLVDWAAYTAAGAGATNSAAGSLSGFHAQGQQDRTLSAAEAQQRQYETYQAAVALKQGLMTPEQLKTLFPNADPAIFLTPPGAPLVTSPATGVMPGVTAGFASSEALTPAAAAPGATPAAVTPAAVVPESALARIGALVQSANAKQLQSSARTLAGQQQQLAQQLTQLTQQRQQLAQQLAAYSAQANKETSPFTLPSEYGPARLMVDALKSKLEQVDASILATGQSAEQLTQLLRSIDVRARSLLTPGMSAQPALASDWAAQLEKELSK